MKIEICDNKWTKEYVTYNSDKIFIFEENNTRTGDSAIRDCDNSIGLRVKKGPSRSLVSSYTDNELESNIKNILEDILLIKKRAISENKTLVFLKSGYGLDKPTKTLIFLNNQLRAHFDFDNESGEKLDRIPSVEDIEKSKLISLDLTKYDYLYKDSISNLIKSGKKVAFTQNIKYKTGELITFLIEDESILCEVIESYPTDILDDDSKSIFDCVSLEFLNKNRDIYQSSDYLQTHFKFISSIDKSGNLILSNSINYISNNENSNSELKEESVESIDLLEEIKNLKSQIRELKTPFYKKFYRNIESHILKKFGKKTLEFLLKKHGLNGNLSILEGVEGSNKYYKLSNSEKTYYVEFIEGFLKNKINILITFRNE